MGKERHGGLTAVLVMLTLGGLGTAVTYLALLGASLHAPLAVSQGWAFWALGLAILFKLLCVVALFAWRRWAFWGFCASAALLVALNIFLGLSAVGSFVDGALGIGLLYTALQLGDRNKGWPQLE